VKARLAVGGNQGAIEELNSTVALPLEVLPAMVPRPPGQARPFGRLRTLISPRKVRRFSASIERLDPPLLREVESCHSGGDASRFSPLSTVLVFVS
jgi:hypothetical protein